MQKKTQKITVAIIIAVISITLIGSSFVAIFQPDTPTDRDQSQAVLEKEYQDRKQNVETIGAKLKEKPEDLELIRALADAYYDKARISNQFNVDEYKEDLQKAIEMYKKVLTVNEDKQAMLKLATAAFLFGDKELAEKTYTDLLNKEPDNVDALYGYGMYLFYEKGDSKQAEEKWQKAKSLTQDEQMQSQLEQMINLAQGKNINAGEKNK